jgi:hypothetical protein
LKTDERKKALELSRNWLKEEVKNNHSAEPAIFKRALSYRKKFALMIGIAVLFVGVVIIMMINNLSQHNADKQKQPGNQQSIESQTTNPALSATATTPLSTTNSSGVEQPAQNSDEKAARPAKHYPSGWPEELNFPAQFTLQDANTVRTHDNALPAYAVQMGFDGDIQTAAESFSSYFEKRGWQIVERSELDSGAVQIKVARYNGRDSGNITIDPDPLNTGKTRIIAIIFF